MSNVFQVTVRPRDAIIARDGRPFSTGQRMRSLDWLYPSVVAGSMRTLLGQHAGGFPAGVAEYQRLTDSLKNIAVRGPLLCLTKDGRSELAFPAPLDIVVHRRDGILGARAARPCDEGRSGGGCDLDPELGLFPVMLPESTEPDLKPETVPPFWSASLMASWLADATGESFPLRGLKDWPEGFLRAASIERRYHVKVDPQSGASQDQMLFMTAGLDLTRLLPARASSESCFAAPDVTIAALVAAQDEWAPVMEALATWSPIGGERRIAYWETSSLKADPPIWSIPPQILTALQSPGDSGYVRMALATPAIFDNGWYPGWLRPVAGSKRLSGTLPGSSIRVTLIGASVGRWKPLSGWSYEPPAGPKAVRRMVPAGSVYFFRVEAGQPEDFAAAWLHAVSDVEQDRLDGFGLALWGVWKPFDLSNTFE